MAVKAHTVTEAFTAAPGNPPWRLYGGATVTGGQLRLGPPQGSTAYAGAEYTANRLDFTESSLLFEVADRGNQALGSWQCLLAMMVNAAQTTAVLWVIEGGNLKLVNDPAGQIFATTHSAVNHRWLRFRITGATFYLDASPNGTTWTQLHTGATTALGMAMNDCYLIFEAGTYSVEASASACLIDNLNLPPAPAASGRPAVWTGAAFATKPGMLRTAGGWVEKPWLRWTGTQWKTLP